ncbi:c-type cytochrome biogenesis protein CcmI [Nitrosomonas supralitoralis]|uniref:C-type cytochrome biogenesis protein CcmI n=1 Tax=Nitrosomonas supralitoralis TaxID=2116706 RepID=A0A2P7NYH9_9PROT|nr:c-type cytochrome biogenesis protein CcmI [Nitrosomonas supralitoralis]PSJ18487.1 c-type cytochrome biogenesis protein CcmI [Nitrosomonas supralitoralis]
MTAFWVISGIFIVTALLFIIPTLLRNKNTQVKNLEHDAVNITVYRDQLVELDKDLENDILSQEQYDKSKQELQQRMLQDVTQVEEVTLQKNKKSHNIALSTVIALMLPLSAVFLYLNIGDTRGLLSQEQLASATQMNRTDGGEDTEGHDFSAALETLIARLSNNPGDIEGWVMLGRTYTAMERYTEASNTYAKLAELVPNNPQILSDYARVLGLKNQGTLAGKPTELLYEALAIDPQFPPALALAGHAEFEQEKYSEASTLWEKLLTTIPPDSPLAKSVRDSIAEAKLLASDGKGEVSDQPIAASEPAVETDVQPVNNTAADTSETTALAVSGQVNIQPELASKVAPNDTLFIYARASTGPKMPLAILRLKASDLPATFTLTDDMAMMPTMKMSSFPEIVIEARISKSGQAVPASGDLQGFSKPIKVGNDNIAIVIDKQIP